MTWDPGEDLGFTVKNRGDHGIQHGFNVDLVGISRDFHARLFNMNGFTHWKSDLAMENQSEMLGKPARKPIYK